MDRRCQHTLWGLGGVLVRELDLKLEEATLPQSLFLARDRALPFLEIETALRVLCGLCDEAEGMIFAPLFSLFRETVLTERHCGKSGGSDCRDSLLCLRRRIVDVMARIEVVRLQRYSWDASGRSATRQTVLVV